MTDQQGAAIPGATLTLTDQLTNQKIVRTSNGTGVFNFNALPSDRFNLAVEREGFQKKELSDLKLIPEQPNALNVQMEIGAASQTVTVSAATAPAVDTETAAIGRTIESNEIEHMPSFNRDVFQLTQLAPGAVSDASRAGAGNTYNLPGNQGPGGSTAGAGIFQTENSPQANANGQQFETNSIAIDGISTVSAVWGGTSVITPNEDSVADMKIVTNAYDAENGRFSGAVTQITSKSGSNNFHGSLFFQAHRPGLDAYQRYNGPAFYSAGAVTPTDKGLLRDSQDFNQYGGSAGGPVWKNKIFVFFAYETVRNNSSVTGTGWYDTSAFDALAPTGSIAAKYLTFPGAGVKSAGIVAQTCQNAGLIEGVSCRTIPGQGLNIGSPLTTPLGTQDLTWTSNPNDPGVGGGLANVADIADYVTVNPTTLVETQYNGRADADVTSKDHLTAAIYWVPVSQTNYNGGARAYNLFHHDAINDAFSGIWNHTFSASLLNEARANAAGWRYNEIADNPQAPVGLPQITIGQLGSIGGSLNPFGSSLGSDLDQWTYGYKDVVTKIAANHTIKFGGEFTRLYYLFNPVGRPNYTVFNVWDFLNDAPKQEQGQFNAVTGFPGGNRADNRENLWGLFVQDDWKVAPGLTLTFGMRYGYFGSLYTKQNNLSVVQFGSGSSYLTGLTLRQGGNLWTPQKLNFGPQIGFNWSPGTFHSKVVIRGGFGLNFNQEEIAISSNINFNPPGTGTYNFNSTVPTAINPAILYGISSSPTSLTGFASNPNTVTAFNSSLLPLTGNATLYAVPNRLPTQYTQHYSLETEYDFRDRIVVSAGYQGSTSRHIIIEADANAVAAAEGIPLNPLVSSTTFWNNEGGANNNMFLASVRHPFARAFSAEAQFAWAKSMDTDSGPYEKDAYPYSGVLPYGRSDYNIGKSLKIFGVWQPVLFRGNHGWIEKVAGEWSLSGILDLHTGFPWTPTYNTTNLYCSSCGYTSLRPIYLGGGGRSTSNNTFKSGPGVGNGQNSNFPGIDSTVTQMPTSYANKYFAVPDYSTALAGSGTGGASLGPPPTPGVARNSFDGPGYRDVDVSLTKGFGLPKAPVLGENARIEFRVDAYNLFNLLSFDTANVTKDIASPTFGQAQEALGARTVALQARFSF